jgi:adenosylhomocysteine nucleosidase
VIALVGALETELATVRRRLGLRCLRGCTDRSRWHGRIGDTEILLIRTGIGKARAAAATRTALDQYDAGVLVSFGFAGALRDDLRVGDIVLASEVLDLQAAEGEAALPRREPLDHPAIAPWLEERTRSGVPVSPGRLLTAPRVLRDPEEKQAFGERFGARIVDMESFSVAQIAAERGIPFIGLRVVSDAVRDRVPDLPIDRLFTPDGRLDRREAARQALLGLGNLRGSLRLWRNAQIAKRRLTFAVSGLVKALANERES